MQLQKLLGPFGHHLARAQYDLSRVHFDETPNDDGDLFDALLGQERWIGDDQIENALVFAQVVGLCGQIVVVVNEIRAVRGEPVVVLENVHNSRGIGGAHRVVQRGARQQGHSEGLV